MQYIDWRTSMSVLTVRLGDSFLLSAVAEKTGQSKTSLVEEGLCHVFAKNS